MKTKQFVRDELLPAGAVEVRRNGDHHIFKLPSGQLVVVSMGGGHTEMRPRVLMKIRKQLKAEAEKAKKQA